MIATFLKNRETYYLHRKNKTIETQALDTKYHQMRNLQAFA